MKKKWCFGVDNPPLAIQRRSEVNDTICLILDAAPQHNFEGMADICMEHNIIIISVPEGLTHIYQPADQYVIACLKSKAQSMWNEFVSDIFSSHEPDSAIAKVFTSQHIARQRKYSFLAKAIDDLSESSILASWDATGIRREMWGYEPRRRPLIDDLKQKAVWKSFGNR